MGRKAVDEHRETERRKARAVFTGRPTEGLVAPAGAPSPSDSARWVYPIRAGKKPRAIESQPGTRALGLPNSRRRKAAGHPESPHLERLTHSRRETANLCLLVIPGRAQREPGIQTQAPSQHLDSGFAACGRAPE
jgi:hypothetical protein